MMPHNPRFSILQGRAVKDKRLSDPQFRTLADLGTYTDNEGWCFPSLQTIGEDLGKSAQAVSKDIEALVKTGYIEKHKRQTKERGNIANRYRLVFDTPYQSSVDSLSTSEVDSLSTSEVEGRIPLEGSHVVKEQSGNKRRKPLNPDEPFKYEYPEPLKAYGEAWEALYEPSRRAMDASEYVMWVNGGGRSGARGFRHYAKAGITPDEMVEAYHQMMRQKLTVKNPNSLWAFAFDIHSRNAKHGGNGKSLKDEQAERRAEFEESKPITEE